MNKFQIKRNWNKFWNIRKPYLVQGLLYLNDKGVPVRNEITDKIKWLDQLTIHHWSIDDAELEAFIQLNEKYPQYKGKIWLL